ELRRELERQQERNLQLEMDKQNLINYIISHECVSSTEHRRLILNTFYYPREPAHIHQPVVPTYQPIAPVPDYSHQQQVARPAAFMMTNHQQWVPPQQNNFEPTANESTVTMQHPARMEYTMRPNYQPTAADSGYGTDEDHPTTSNQRCDPQPNTFAPVCYGSTAPIQPAQMWNTEAMHPNCRPNGVDRGYGNNGLSTNQLSNGIEPSFSQIPINNTSTTILSPATVFLTKNPAPQVLQEIDPDDILRLSLVDCANS
ncbi:hypothetical protein PFISCL1PPCAC_3830, partial [Pristionchus fissidentatus]